MYRHGCLPAGLLALLLLLRAGSPTPPSAEAAAAPPAGGGAAALGKWCGAVKSAGDTTACDRCVLRSDDPLTAAGCTVAEAAAFCPTHTKKPPTAPPKCQAALEKACGPAQPKGNRACMLCVYASKKDGSTLEVAG